MRAEHLVAINAARRARRAVILVTDIVTGAGQVIAEGAQINAVLRVDAERVFRTGKSGLVELDGRKLFFNVQVPPPRIVVIGAVHISQALAAIAPVAGYDLRIIDPRTAFATPERFAGVDLTADWPEDVLKERPLDAYTALVAVTHDPKIDDFPIADALRTGCFYVGALGSRKTHAKRVERLMATGIGDDLIARIDAPIGLDIGAQSPSEIAVAVMGAIIHAFRRRTLHGAKG
jgi:xanthine dehydrogenase accessory factor